MINKYYKYPLLLVIMLVIGRTAIAGSINNGAGGSGSATVNPVSGAIAEYPITEGTGTAVNDISGNGHTASFCSTAPTWTTFGVNVASGACISTPLQTWTTAFIHVCHQPNGFSGQFPTLIGTHNATNGVDIFTIPTFNYDMEAVDPGIYSISTGNMVTSSGVASVPQPCVTTAVVLGASDHLYLNGSEQPYAVQSVSSSYVTIGSGGYDLGSDSTSSFAFDGFINYAVFYNSALTQAQISSETNYINAKVAARPGFNTYNISGLTQNQSASAQVICVGDSLTYGIGGTTYCTQAAMGLNNTYAFHNNGIASQGVMQKASEISAIDLTYIAANGGKSYIPLWEGTNDVCNGSTPLTAQQTWNYIQSTGQQIKAAGGIPIVYTMISRTGCDAAKDLLNPIIRANWRNTFAALVDVAAVGVLGADGAYLNQSSPACFYSDGIHLVGPGAGTCINSLSGYGEVGLLAGDIINILDGTTATTPTITASNAYTQNIVDSYVQQTPTSAATDVLPDCTGLTGIQRTISNGSASNAITVSGGGGSSTIVGSTTVAANTAATFVCQLTSNTAGGNY